MSGLATRLGVECTIAITNSVLILSKSVEFILTIATRLGVEYIIAISNSILILSRSVVYYLA